MKKMRTERRVEELDTMEKDDRKISRDGMREALKRMRNGKSVGSDEGTRSKGRGVFDKTDDHDLGH